MTIFLNKTIVGSCKCYVIWPALRCAFFFLKQDVLPCFFHLNMNIKDQDWLTMMYVQRKYFCKKIYICTLICTHISQCRYCSQLGKSLQRLLLLLSKVLKESRGSQPKSINIYSIYNILMFRIKGKISWKNCFTSTKTLGRWN